MGDDVLALPGRRSGGAGVHARLARRPADTRRCARTAHSAHRSKARCRSSSRPPRTTGRDAPAPVRRRGSDAADRGADGVVDAGRRACQARASGAGARHRRRGAVRVAVREGSRRAGDRHLVKRREAATPQAARRRCRLQLPERRRTGRKLPRGDRRARRRHHRRDRGRHVDESWRRWRSAVSSVWSASSPATRRVRRAPAARPDDCACRGSRSGRARGSRR